jgi:para-nitrobenzyl esterase
MPPAPAACWTGVREASGFGYACMQSPNRVPDGTPSGSEDCLTLNVWSSEPGRGAGRPVFVFIHGGFFTWGSASLRVSGVDAYDGAELAARAGAVVVTLNYRLGALGFIAHPALAQESEHHAAGNYGLLDQLAALAWVQRNIAGFGGDPARVTLFGQSAGAISTAALYASPLGRGLYARAILHSGSGAAGPLEQALSAGQALGHSLGCDGDDAAALACLRARSASEVVSALPESFGGSGYAFGPNVDGWVLPGRPIDLVRAGQGSTVPLVIGVTADEFTTMISSYVSTPVRTPADYEAFLQDHYGQAAAAWAVAHYPVSAYPTPLDALVAFYGDLGLICPSRRLARAAAAHAPVRRFVFTHTSESPVLAPYRAGHGLDLPYVFRNFIGGAPAPDELALSDTMVAYWSRLAATGDPNGPEDPRWPVYDAAADTALRLDTASALEAGFHRAGCDAWDAALAGTGRDF